MLSHVEIKPRTLIRQLHTIPHEYHVEDDGGLVAARGQYVVFYNLHSSIIITSHEDSSTAPNSP